MTDLESSLLNNHDKAVSLILAGQKKENLSMLLKGALSEEPMIRSGAAAGLGYYGGRDVHEPLKKLMVDKGHMVRCDAILGLGCSKDSRAVFCLVNYYKNPEFSNPEIKQRILFAFQDLKDPRARGFLAEAAKTENLGFLREMALKALQVSSRNHNFMYTFSGDNGDARIEESKNKEGMTPVKTYRDLEKVREALEYFYKERHPQTYIVNQDCSFVIGGYIEEHVAVARGRDILAAGEAFFIPIQGGGWKIRELNNRSNGYYPHHNSIYWVRKALKNTGVEFPTQFSKKYDFLKEEILMFKPFYRSGTKKQERN
jgi:hypothetical protein